MPAKAPAPPASPPEAEVGTSLSERALALVATALPFGLALSRAASSGQWRDDVSAVRDVGLVAVGFGGGLSTVVTQAAGLVPLGSLAFRAALGSALALAVAARLLYALTLRLLAATAPAGPAFRATLAAIATLTAALSPTWQREATIGGGAMLSTAVALGALSVGLATFDPTRAALPNPARAFIGLGALLGAALAESPPAALALAAALGAMLFADRLPLGALAVLLRVPGARAIAPGRFRAPPRRVVLGSVGACVAVAALLAAPLLLRPFAPRAWVDLGRALSAASLGALDVAGPRTTALAAWITEVGAVSLGIAAFGLGAALLAPRTRALAAALAVLVLCDTLWPARLAGVLAADPLTSLRSLAVAALGMASAAGVHRVVAALLAARLPMARSGAVLVVVFHLTLVALASEDASFVADRSQQFGAEEWADAALGGLEPQSAVLVRSPAVAWRLFAARMTRGERPDVVAVPVPLLSRGRVASNLLAADRSFEPLLRDFALTGEPSEFALSKAADARPLHVELDRAWSRRLVSHLTLGGLWLEYAPQPLGPSDRKLALGAATAPLARLLRVLAASPVPDPSTAAVVAETLRGHAAVLDVLGEGEAAQAFLDRIGPLMPKDPVGGAVAQGSALADAAHLVAAREGLRPR
jgi:hypothetical protein